MATTGSNLGLSKVLIPFKRARDELLTMAYFPDELRKCVVFLGYTKADGTFHLSGTGFFVHRDLPELGPNRGFTYLVTARHVIEGIANKGINKVHARVNLAAGGTTVVSTFVSDWTSHRNPTVDVSLVRVSMYTIYDHKSFPLHSCDINSVSEEQRPDLGNEIFITGLFSQHYGNEKNIPIVRTGNIAALPGEPVRTKLGPMEAYLVEARSIGGLSGSPVFLNLSGFKRTGVVIAGAGLLLIGIMHGHFDTTLPHIDSVADDGIERVNVNMGIGIVVPSSAIFEILQDLRPQEQAIIEKKQKAEQTESDV